jgi:hypothetical protein
MAQYTWQEQVSIVLKGEQKKQEHFQVQLGPDGKPQKTSLDTPAAPQASGRREGRLKEHVVEEKKEEYQQYADQMKELIQQYLPPDKDMLAQAQQKGNITVGAQPGTERPRQLVDRNLPERPEGCGERIRPVRSDSGRPQSRLVRNNQRRQQAADNQYSEQQLPEAVEGLKVESKFPR